ncbi:MAG: phage tail protein, partial [Thermoanaerobaculia bacterium]
MGRRRAVRSPEPLPPQYIPPDVGDDEEEPTPHSEVTHRTAKGKERRDLMLPGVDDGPRAFLNGEQRTGGKLQFAHYLTAGDDLWGVIELCAGECDGLIDVKRADGRGMPAKGGSAWDYWWYPGTAAGQVDPNLQSVLPSWNEPFAGTCYVVVRLKKFGQGWKGEMPEMIWRMRTMKLLMPDSGLYVYSTNVWDQLFNFARHPEGKALPAARVDAASFVAARAADATAGRKTDCHLALWAQQDPNDVIKTLLVVARAYWFDEGGIFRVVADRPGSPVATYDDDAFSRSVPVEPTRADILSRVNRVTVWYTDVANGWAEKSYSYPEVDPPDPIYEEELRLPHLHDPALVKTVALYRYNSAVFDARVTGRWLAQTEERALGDIVTVHLENKGLLLPARLLRRKKNADNTFDVALFEHNDLKHAEYGIVEPTKISSTLPDPEEAPPDVDLESITFAEEAYDTQEGVQRTRGILAFTLPEHPYVKEIEVWLSVNGGTQRKWFSARSSPALTPALWETGTYQLTLRSRQSITQELSPGTVFNATVDGIPTSAPSAPGALTLTDIGNSVLKVTFTPDSSHPFYSHTRVTLNRTIGVATETMVLGEVAAGPLYFTVVGSTATYTARARTVVLDGTTSSEAASGPVTIAGVAGPAGGTMTLTTTGTGAKIFSPTSAGRDTGTDDSWAVGAVRSLEGYARGAY